MVIIPENVSLSELCPLPEGFMVEVPARSFAEFYEYKNRNVYIEFTDGTYVVGLLHNFEGTTFQVGRDTNFYSYSEVKSYRAT